MTGGKGSDFSVAEFILSCLLRQAQNEREKELDKNSEGIRMTIKVAGFRLRLGFFQQRGGSLLYILAGADCQYCLEA